jgi:hypothetical protein
MQIFLCALSLLTMLKGRSHYRIWKWTYKGL